MLIRYFHITADHLEMFLEVFDEFLVFLIAPRSAKRMQLRPQRSHPLLQLLIEFLQVLRESPQFVRINYCLRHGSSLFKSHTRLPRQSFPARCDAPDWGQPAAEPPEARRNDRSLRQLGSRKTVGN